jgi:hypothetical protein
MTIKVNNRYRLSKEYISTLNKKPITDLVKIEVMYGDIITYSDGVDKFTDRIVNLVPNLSEPDSRFNVSSSVKKVLPTPVAPTPIEPEPVAPTPVEPEPVAPPPSGNPYEDNYI